MTGKKIISAICFDERLLGIEREKSVLPTFKLCEIDQRIDQISGLGYLDFWIGNSRES